MVRFWLVIFSCARLLGLCLSARTPGCPPVDPGIQCIRIDAQCKSDSYCKIDEACCDIPCGTKCMPIGVCEQREYEGTCGNLFARFRYDSSKKKCIKFAYSGCNGNDNNFKTLDDCDKACKKSVCLLPKDTGQCKRAVTRYYYNTANRKCEKFIYHGCHGNGNNFLTEKGCKRLCTNIANTCPPDPPCPRSPPPPPGTCRPPCIFTYGVINGLKCKVKCELGDVPPEGPPGAPCPNTNCTNQGTVDPPSPMAKANTCPPDPTCPRSPAPPTGTCRPPCIYTYGVINGLVCKVKCELGQAPPSGAPGTPCPQTNCPSQGTIEPPPPSTTGNTCPPDPPCPRSSPPTGTCRPPCIYTYGIINGRTCKVKCELGRAPPMGAPGAPCPQTNCPNQGIIEPPHPPSTTGCQKGIPLANVRCDGPGSSACPKGYFCVRSVCCQM